jgi:hypothetical protein
MHAFSIDKGDQTDGTENQSGDQIPGAEIEHIDLTS